MRFLDFWCLLGSMGEPGGMPGTPQRHTKLKKGFGMIFRTLFGHSGEALGDQGGDQEPPRWPGDATPEAYGGHPGGQKAARATRAGFWKKKGTFSRRLGGPKCV